jgi:hypothetical protein
VTETKSFSELAGRGHRSLDVLHGVSYYAPEIDQKLTEAGLRPGRMCYFAGRSAAMGAVGAGVVAATFYNFNPSLVHRHIPRAWTLASPADVLAARLAGVDLGLRRLLGAEVIESADLAEAAALAREASQACTAEGRPLFGAHAELDWPAEPHLQLWHAATLLREHRGDGHLAALVRQDLSGIDAIVTHTATGRGFLEPAAKLLRGWSDEEWAASVRSLQERGVLDEAGTGLTEQGQALRARLEAETDEMAVAPWRRLGTAKGPRLIELTRSLARQVIAAGAYPDGVFAQR